MKSKVHLFDILGKYCGMHYYDEAFGQLLECNSLKVIIHSNYSSDCSSDIFFKVFYKYNKLAGIVLLFWYYIKFTICINPI